MATWSLPILLKGVHDRIHQQLETASATIGHPGSLGDSSESVWLELFQMYLPKRYQAERAFVVDSLGNFSDQMDVVIFDRQYSPFIFTFKEQMIVPAESVYAVFEAKQTITAEYIKYAQDKVASVRKLHKTTLPIPHAGGTYPRKPPIEIIGGILTFESAWKPPMGKTMLDTLNSTPEILNIGCVAAHGYFNYLPETKKYEIILDGMHATAFLFKLISQLQFAGTVPMIDVMQYSKWLTA